MSNKPFSKALYNETNHVGINTSMSLLNQLGYKTIDTKEAYSDRDYIVSKKGKALKIEAELSRAWRSDSFTWQHLSVPYRKHRSGADIFIMSNHSNTACMVGLMSDVKASRIDKKYISMSNMTEDFFFCDPAIFDLYVLEEGEWIVKRAGKMIL